MDAGHYPAEPGVISASGKPELEFNLALAREVKRAVETGGLEVRMVRNHPALHLRTREAAGADLFLSIHHDSVKPQFVAQDRIAAARRRFLRLALSCRPGAR